jgi:hypothetical protein
MEGFQFGSDRAQEISPGSLVVEINRYCIVPLGMATGRVEQLFARQNKPRVEIHTYTLTHG